MRYIFLVFLFLCGMAFAHEGHHLAAIEEGLETPLWFGQLGRFHLIALHFPIALINMVVISECLYAWYKQEIFAFSSRFMLYAGAVLAVPTALLGLLYSYSVPVYGQMATLLFWHMWCGIITVLLAVLTLVLKEKRGRSSLYYFFLVLLVLLVNTTAFFGGKMAFGF